MENRSVSLAFSLQQLLDAVFACKILSQQVEGLHLNSEKDERNTLSAIGAVLELIGLQGENLQRCLRGELNPLAVYNSGNAAPEETIVNWKDIRLEVGQESKPILSKIKNK